MRFEEHLLSGLHGGTLVKAYHSAIEPQSRPYREHHHTESEISLFIEGEGIYTVGERVYPYKGGDVFLFGSNEAHSITEVTARTHILNIHFEPRILWEQPENRPLLALFDDRRPRIHRFENDETLAARLLQTEKELRERGTCYRLEAVCALLSALVHIMRAYGVIEWGNDGHLIASTEGLSDAVDYINANLENKLTLSSIADVAHMTAGYFSTLFKKYNGVSPWEYITIKRVEKAIEMLKSTDMTKLEIAERCGFSSASNFYKAFLRVTGKKPGDYQKKQVREG